MKKEAGISLRVLVFYIFVFFFGRYDSSFAENGSTCLTVASNPDIISSRIHEHTFVASIRGVPLKVRYITNFHRISRLKPLVFVVPGLSKGAFEEQVQVLGTRGVQAVSLDLLNIGDMNLLEAPSNWGQGTGFLKEQDQWIFEAATFDDDAELSQQLLLHLNWPKKSAKAPLRAMTHSRGAEVLYRWQALYPDQFFVESAFLQNPYSGWISDFWRESTGDYTDDVTNMFIEGSRFWAQILGGDGLSNMVERNMQAWGRQTRQWTERNMEFLMWLQVDIHNRSKAHAQIGKLIHSENPVEIERIRQKLIGMEGTSVDDDLQAFVNSGVRLQFLRSEDWGDELVPDRQVDGLAERFGIPVMTLPGTHYLPYEFPEETVDAALDFFNQSRYNFPR